MTKNDQVSSWEKWQKMTKNDKKWQKMTKKDKKRQKKGPRLCSKTVNWYDYLTIGILKNKKNLPDCRYETNDEKW